jgi:TRAP-type transport system periplasmic protein
MPPRYSIMLAIAAVIAMFATTILAPKAQPAPAVIKLSVATLNDANHEWVKRFAALIENRSDGRIKADVYPASQLGSIPRQIEGIQLGSIQITIVPSEFLVGVDQRFELLAAPGIFHSNNQVIKTITDPEFADAFLAIGASKGLLGAGITFNGPAALAMRAPARILTDFKGKKIRVIASPFPTEQIARLGGTGVPMTLGDVLPALQQGTLDGALASVPVISTLQFQETTKAFVGRAEGRLFAIVLRRGAKESARFEIVVVAVVPATKADPQRLLNVLTCNRGDGWSCDQRTRGFVPKFQVAFEVSYLF